MKTKVFIDTNIYIVHLRYKNDKNYETNKKIIDLLINGEIKGFTSIYNLFEIAGILSFNLNKDQLKEFIISFPSMFNTTILFPNKEEKKICFDYREIIEMMLRQIAFLDALILDLFEKSNVSIMLTWNAKHFRGKTKKEILTPEEFFLKK